MERLVIDTSSLIAIVLQEPGYQAHLAVLSQAKQLNLSAVSRVELSMVGKSRGVEEVAVAMLERLAVQILPFDAHQAGLAISAFDKYGKGRHPAALNFGDCCSYALAKSLDLPLLFKGNDFSQTDIALAVI